MLVYIYVALKPFLVLDCVYFYSGWGRPLTFKVFGVYVGSRPGCSRCRLKKVMFGVGQRWVGMFEMYLGYSFLVENISFVFLLLSFTYQICLFMPIPRLFISALMLLKVSFWEGASYALIWLCTTS